MDERTGADIRGMDQLSRPLLIVLASTIVLAALWLAALRPGPVAVSGATAPVQAVANAREASAASDAANSRLQARSGGTATTPGAPAAAPAAKAPAPVSRATEPAAAPADRREPPAVRDIRAGGKVVVLLFWNSKGADDASTRAAVRGLDRHDGKVAVHVVPIAHVGRYEAITSDVTVAQSPTTLVVDGAGRARTIVGLTERGELAQAVDDALARRR